MEVYTAEKKKLYYYQEHDINLMFNDLCGQSYMKARLLYQLPTGGGKTVVFSEIVKRFVHERNKKVLVLTHRIELCNQTAKILKTVGVKTRTIHSGVKRLPKNDTSECYVAMVQTLKNRLKDGLIKIEDIGLVVIDEAHHNSFHKLIGRFKNAALIGVTATPFSSDVNLPMHKHYEKLILGEQIPILIQKGFLAKPKIHEYDIELNSLRTGISGFYSKHLRSTLRNTSNVRSSIAGI